MLNADLKCLKELVKLNKEHQELKENTKNTYKWKYSSSMAGVELPIVTYSKFHQQVSGLGERSSVESFGFNTIPRNSSVVPLLRYNSTNIQLLSRLRSSQKRDCLNCRKPNIYGKWNVHDPLVFSLQNPLPEANGEKYNFRIFKGLKNVILHWTDADFMIHHPVALQFHKWQNNASMPEETFFATLIRFKIDKFNNSITQVLYIVLALNSFLNIINVFNVCCLIIINGCYSHE